VCVLISISATLVFARTNLKLHWRIASAVFAPSAYALRVGSSREYYQPTYRFGLRWDLRHGK
jgi:hypothetical protein